MNPYRCIVMGLVIVLFWGGSEAVGQFQKKDLKKFGRFFGRDKKSNVIDSLKKPIVTADIATKLRLTYKQRVAADKLNKEYAGKLKVLTDKVPASATQPKPGEEIREKIREQIRENLLKKLRENKDIPDNVRDQIKAKIMEKLGGSGGPAINPNIQKAFELRMQYEKKFEDSLSAAQTKILDKIRIAEGESLLAPDK